MASGTGASLGMSPLRTPRWYFEHFFLLKQSVSPSVAQGQIRQTSALIRIAMSAGGVLYVPVCSQNLQPWFI